VIENHGFRFQPGRQRGNLMVSDRLKQRAADHLAGKSEKRLGCTVGQRDAAHCIQHHQPIQHAVQQRLHPALVGFQRRAMSLAQRRQFPDVPRRLLGTQAPDMPPRSEGGDGKQDEKDSHGSQLGRMEVTSQL